MKVRFIKSDGKTALIDAVDWTEAFTKAKYLRERGILKEFVNPEVNVQWKESGQYYTPEQQKLIAEAEAIKADPNYIQKQIDADRLNFKPRIEDNSVLSALLPRVTSNMGVDRSMSPIAGALDAGTLPLRAVGATIDSIVETINAIGSKEGYRVNADDVYDAYIKSLSQTGATNEPNKIERNFASQILQSMVRDPLNLIPMSAVTNVGKTIYSVVKGVKIGKRSEQLLKSGKTAKEVGERLIDKGRRDIITNIGELVTDAGELIANVGRTNIPRSVEGLETAAMRYRNPALVDGPARQMSVDAGIMAREAGEAQLAKGASDIAAAKQLMIPTRGELGIRAGLEGGLEGGRQLAEGEDFSPTSMIMAGVSPLAMDKLGKKFRSKAGDMLEADYKLKSSDIDKTYPPLSGEQLFDEGVVPRFGGIKGTMGNVKRKIDDVGILRQQAKEQLKESENILKKAARDLKNKVITKNEFDEIQEGLNINLVNYDRMFDLAESDIIEQVADGSLPEKAAAPILRLIDSERRSMNKFKIDAPGGGLLSEIMYNKTGKTGGLGELDEILNRGKYWFQLGKAQRGAFQADPLVTQVVGNKALYDAQRRELRNIPELAESNAGFAKWLPTEHALESKSSTIAKRSVFDGLGKGVIGSILTGQPASRTLYDIGKVLPSRMATTVPTNIYQMGGDESAAESVENTLGELGGVVKDVGGVVKDVILPDIGSTLLNPKPVPKKPKAKTKIKRAVQELSETDRRWKEYVAERWTGMPSSMINNTSLSVN